MSVTLPVQNQKNTTDPDTNFQNKNNMHLDKNKNMFNLEPSISL